MFNKAVFNINSLISDISNKVKNQYTSRRPPISPSL